MESNSVRTIIISNKTACKSQVCHLYEGSMGLIGLGKEGLTPGVL